MNIMNYTQIDVIYLLFYYISNTNSLVIALDNGDISPISLFFRIKKAKEWHLDKGDISIILLFVKSNSLSRAHLDKVDKSFILFFFRLNSVNDGQFQALLANKKHNRLLGIFH